MDYIPAKSILSPRRPEGWFASDYTVNLYRGCCHGCIYCDSRSECYGITDFDTVRAKRDAVEILTRELRGKRRAGVVLTGSMSDPYNPFEEKERLTRRGLQALVQYGFGAAVLTKSPLVTRDIDLFRQMGKRAPTSVSVTITTAEDDLCCRIERHVAPSSQRLAALTALARAGVPCGVLLSPVLPFINDTEENIRAIVSRAADAGCRWVYAEMAFGVTLRQNQRLYFYDRLDEAFPGLKQRYIRQYGDQYACYSPDTRRLWQAFASACEARGLLYRMEDISAMLKAPYQATQLSLFGPGQ
ncbi:MAG: radical SAM protein [Clostridia bacterium]|nr:radical SAM protein [Clostridia bacterium]